MVSIPNYVTKALHKFQHPTPKRAQYAPTPSMDAPKLWCNKATSNSLGYFAANTR